MYVQPAYVGVHLYLGIHHAELGSVDPCVATIIDSRGVSGWRDRRVCVRTRNTYVTNGVTGGMDGSAMIATAVAGSIDKLTSYLASFFPSFFVPSGPAAARRRRSEVVPLDDGYVERFPTVPTGPKSCHLTADWHPVLCDLYPLRALFLLLFRWFALDRPQRGGSESVYMGPGDGWVSTRANCCTN